MIALSPGIAFVLKKVFELSIPTFTVYFLLARTLGRFNITPLSVPGFLALECILYILGVALGRRLMRIRNYRTAVARGELLPPVVSDPWPFNLGFLTKMIRAFQAGQFGEVVLAVSRELGNVFSVQTGFGPLQYITMEPSHIKAILATCFDDWEKGARFHNQMKSVLGVGVFNSDGDMWKFHRAMTRPFFSKERISDFDIFDAHVMDAIAQAKRRLAAGYPIDIQDMCSRISLDSATAFLFNHDVRSLSAGLIYPPGTLESANHDSSHSSNIFARAFSDCQRQIALRTFLGEAWPLAEMTGEATKASMHIVNNFIEPLIAEALKRKKSTDEKSPSEDTEHLSLLDLLVTETDDPHVIKDETLNIMIAGRDTIAAALSFAAYMLSEHPEVLKRLRQEVLDVAGASGRPTHDDIKNMKYMRAFINETLRLYPPLPFDIRSAIRDTTFPSPTRDEPSYFVPKGTECIYGVSLMHRREDLWGPDASVFDPDRFLDERVHKYLTPNPFIFLPFNAGPRICLGQQFAYNEISFTLVRLLQTFDCFSLAPDAQPTGSLPPTSWTKDGGGRQEKIILKQHLTMYCHGGLWIRMSEATSADVL